MDAVVAGAAHLPPRALVGFSDLTALLNALHDHLGWITFHGPVVTTLGRTEVEVDLDGVLATLRGELRAIDFPRGPGSTVVGKLRGGNLSLLAAQCGTPTAHGPGTDDIWLIEDVSATHYQLDRCFSQLRRSGALASARALWIGDLDLPPDFTEIVCQGFADDSGLPLIGGAPAGHRGRIEVLPIGGQVELMPQEGRLRALGDWLRPVGSAVNA
ncbi:MAG: LD-carboxypeptidase [Myxococcales bacterium]|nr:LD-carboxypeptidase [Myxococcales bacterium]